MTSRYRWQGEVEEAREWNAWPRRRLRGIPEVEAAIAELHSYDEPEIIATPIVAGSSRLPGLGRRELSTEGEAAGTRKLRLAGVGSLLPAASVAQALKVWRPGFRSL